MATTDQPRRAALVFNPVKVDGRRLTALMTTHSANAGWAEPILLETSVEDPGQGITRRALADGATSVLVAGGDGTVRAVAEAMDGSGVPLTILPSGTGNLLARNIGLPLVDPEVMVRAAFEGSTTPIDIGIAALRRADGSTEEHAFVVMAGMGLDAAMIANTSPKLKKRMGWVAYIDGAARSLPAAKAFRVVYQLMTAGEKPIADDKQPQTQTQTRLRSAKIQSILIANCGALPAGISLFPKASIADGLLDVALIQPSGPLGWIGVWRKVWWENSVLRRFRAGVRLAEHRHGTSVLYLTGIGVEAAVGEPRAVQLDGDELGDATRIYCTVHPGGLLVTVPAGHALAG